MFATKKQDDYFKLCCCEKKVSLPFAFLQPFVALGIVKKRATNKRIDLTTLVSVPIVFEPLCLGGNKARLILSLFFFFFLLSELATESFDPIRKEAAATELFF